VRRAAKSRRKQNLEDSNAWAPASPSSPRQVTRVRGPTLTADDRAGCAMAYWNLRVGPPLGTSARAPVESSFGTSISNLLEGTLDMNPPALSDLHFGPLFQTLV
jgi:hypothetical protein